MTIVSYAQNFEDIILWRALKNIENGFYIDVGAAWPEEHSVTQLFYLKGWHGINIEPNPKLHAELAQCRTRDTNLQVAICDKVGVSQISVFGNTGLSTQNRDIAQRHCAAGWQSKDFLVKNKTLTEIWSKHVPVEQDVHFLKVDVEGLEKNVLLSNDWEKYRPWVVIVEATLPLVQEENYLTWENILLSADYLFVYADGLNRFYLAREHQILSEIFKYPPNVFDDFVLNSFQQKASALDTSELNVKRLTAELQGVYNGRSMRITAPLRFIANISRSCVFLCNRFLNTFSKEVPRRAKTRAIKYAKTLQSYLRSGLKVTFRTIKNTPRLRATAKWLFYRFPSLKRFVVNLDRLTISFDKLSYDGYEKLNNDIEKRIYNTFVIISRDSKQ